MKAKVSPSGAAGKRPVRPRGIQSHEIRIIGGQWKRTKLKVADKPGLRPTPDRVRETLFNWLGQDLSGQRCLDVFAGTGALGVEGAARGAAEVALVEPGAAPVQYADARELPVPGIERAQLKLPTEKSDCFAGEKARAAREGGNFP